MARTFSELGRVEAIRQLFEGSGYSPFGEPLHCAAEAGESVSVSRLFLEGTDFSLVYFPLKHLGYKCVVAVTGELYASLAHTRTLSVVLGISAKLDYEQISELWEGIVAAAHEHGYSSLSLDLVPSRNGLAISVSATGLSATVERGMPESKDLVCVSGSLGAAYLGQQALEHERKDLETYKMLVKAYLKPELSPETVAQVENGGIVPSRSYLVSRGLSDAVLRLRRDSGLGVKVYADKIPFEGNSFSLGKELDIDPVSAAMNGGDDFRLLFVVPIARYEDFRREFGGFDIVGHLARPEVGVVLVTPDGLEHRISAQGWQEEDVLNS